MGLKEIFGEEGLVTRRASETFQAARVGHLDRLGRPVKGIYKCQAMGRHIGLSCDMNNDVIKGAGVVPRGPRLVGVERVDTGCDEGERTDDNAKKKRQACFANVELRDTVVVRIQRVAYL